eukprot:5856569-Amphidinium_carterae.1
MSFWVDAVIKLVGHSPDYKGKHPATAQTCLGCTSASQSEGLTSVSKGYSTGAVSGACAAQARMNYLPAMERAHRGRGLSNVMTCFPNGQLPSFMSRFGVW